MGRHGVQTFFFSKNMLSGWVGGSNSIVMHFSTPGGGVIELNCTMIHCTAPHLTKLPLIWWSLVRVLDGLFLFLTTGTI